MLESLTRDLQALIRENQILKAFNRKFVSNMHCLMTRIIDSFKEIYPHLKMPIIYEPTAVNLISTINDCLSNVKAEQERVSATLKEFFGDSSKLPAPISIEQLVGSVKKKIHESKTRQQEVQKESIEHAKQIQRLEAQVNDYSLIIQKLQLQVVDREYSLEKIYLERQADIIEKEKLEKDGFRWKCRYEVVKAELQELKSNLQTGDMVRTHCK